MTDEWEVDDPLTEEMLITSRVIARGRRIRDLQRLLSEYGGTPNRWVKKSTHPLGSAGERLEYHWYEHHGLGCFEVKRVLVDDSP